MEKMTKGMALPELEAHSYAELLPDRIEMRRGNRRSKRIKKGNVKCTVDNVAGLFNEAETIQICQIIK
jgi:hypothetical protein